MSNQTLPDELRSVLLAHSFDAPDPDDTIARTLASTIEAAQIAEIARHLDRPWWRSAGMLVAAVIAVFAIGGAGLIATIHGTDSATSGSAKTAAGSDAQASNGPGNDTGGPAQDMGPARSVAPNVRSSQTNPALLLPNNISCTSVPGGGRTVVTFGIPVKLSGVTDEVVSAQCTDATGQRNSAQVYTIRTVNEQPTLEATVLRQSDGISVDSITGGQNQFTVRYLRLATATTGEALEEKTFRTLDNGATYPDVDTKAVAPVCSASNLTSTVVAGSANDSAVLRVRNSGSAACELSGYPSVIGATRTLGSVGGNGLVPIVVLQPGQTGSARFVSVNPTAPCFATLSPSSITLPSGEKLTGVASQASLNCRALVYPFVSGSG